ncbi:MAG: TRAP transporter large permease [Firmicutes bacterium]|nr:TRAP transporter large permease [Bacillota bacterium]
MITLVFILGLFVLLMIGVPVAYSLGFTSLFVMIIERGIDAIPHLVLSQRMLYGINKFPTLAIPCFLLVGNLMNTVGISQRIFRFANKLVGHLYGGLAHANVIASIIFAGMSGSAVGDAAGLGTVEIEAMKDAGYPGDFSAAITGSSSMIGPIIPPSVPMVFYGILAGVSVTRLFIGGIIPGLLMGVGMMIWIRYQAKKHSYPREEFDREALWESFKKAFFPLWTPIILVGGIWTGIFTPTEAAAVAVLYVLILGFAYNKLTTKILLNVFNKTVRDTSVLLFILAVGFLYGWMIVRLRIPNTILNFFVSHISSPTAAMFILVGFFLVLGCFLSVVVTINITVPILLPIIAYYGIDPLHFGIIMIVTLMLGVLTPPFGNVLYVLLRVSGVPFGKLVKKTFSSAIPVLIVILLLMLFPKIVMFLPSIL